MVSEIIRGNVTVPNGSIREIYEYCVNGLRAEQGQNPYFSLLLYSNEILLRPFYAEIMNKWYDEQQDQKFIEYLNKRDEVILKFADRGNDGQIIYEGENRPRITENSIEFDKALSALNAEYDEVLKANIERKNENTKLLEEAQTIPIFNLKPELMPDNLQPRMVGYFASNIIKELFN